MRVRVYLHVTVFVACMATLFLTYKPCSSLSPLFGIYITFFFRKKKEKKKRKIISCFPVLWIYHSPPPTQRCWAPNGWFSSYCYNTPSHIINRRERKTLKVHRRKKKKVVALLLLAEEKSQRIGKQTKRDDGTTTITAAIANEGENPRLYYYDQQQQQQHIIAILLFILLCFPFRARGTMMFACWCLDTKPTGGRTRRI